MEHGVILDNLVVQESINSPYFMKLEVPLSLSVQPVSCLSSDVLRNLLWKSKVCSSERYTPTNALIVYHILV